MKAIQVHTFGDPEVLRLQELPIPTPGPGEVLITLHAAGINPVETYIRSGKYAKLPPLPYTPGTDGAGRVAAIAPGETSLTVGQRVYVAGSLTGTYAEHALCRADQVFPLPERVSFAQGAALGVPYATAYRALYQIGRWTPGETVLIHGATGAVGLAALQFARQAGAKILCTGGTETGRALLTAQGAAHVFDHHDATLPEQILAATEGCGVPLILEMLANQNLGRDLTMLSAGGRVVVVGSRGPVEIDPRQLMLREASIHAVMLARATAEELQGAHAAIAQGLQEGSLRPVIAQQFPLSEVARGHEAVMAGGRQGKIVLTL